GVDQPLARLAVLCGRADVDGGSNIDRLARSFDEAAVAAVLAAFRGEGAVVTAGPFGDGDDAAAIAAVATIGAKYGTRRRDDIVGREDDGAAIGMGRRGEDRARDVDDGIDESAGRPRGNLDGAAFGENVAGVVDEGIVGT